MKISILIPVFNEAATLGRLLREVRDADVAGLEKEIVVVENGSTDETKAIALRFARDSAGMARVLLFDSPIGKGAAVREALKIATGDILLIQDGDLEYDVRDYPALIRPILEGRTDFVLGSRHLSCGTWKIRRFESTPWKAFLLNCGGRFFHGWFNLLFGTRLTDPTTMFKVFRRECLQGISLVAKRFDFDYELLGKLIRKGHYPLEVPVSYTSRSFGEGKKIDVFRDPWNWLFAILKFRFSPL